MTLPPEKDRRNQSRRNVDRATEDLYKTFSSSHCYAIFTCLFLTILSKYEALFIFILNFE